MTNSLLEIYGQTLTNVVDCLKSSIPAILEQAPEYSEQWINYQINSTIFYAAICLFVVAISSFLIYKRRKLGEEDLLFPIAIPILIFSIIVFFVNVSDLVKIKSAPKVYMIDKFMSYIKR